MQFIGSHQIFCFLRDLTVLRWQKLRAYRCIQNIHKNLLKLRITTCICIIAHQMAHQGLRYRCIHTIHGHMIAIISCPSKSQL